MSEASDGILTSAGICEGFAGAGVGTKVLIFAGFAGLVAGTLAAGAVEYSKLGAERPIVRTAAIGGLAMTITYAAGQLFHP